MVDRVTSTVASGPVPRLNEENAIQRPRSQAGVSSAAPAAPAEVVLFSAAAQSLPPSLAVGAPVDAEAVDRIKLAIREGNYPVDLDKITDSLFASYRELAE